MYPFQIMYVTIYIPIAIRQSTAHSPKASTLKHQSDHQLSWVPSELPGTKILLGFIKYPGSQCIMFFLSVFEVWFCNFSLVYVVYVVGM